MEIIKLNEFWGNGRTQENPQIPILNAVITGQVQLNTIRKVA